MTKVLLTGASGFVGRATAKALIAKDVAVMGLARTEIGLTKGVTPLWADLLGDLSKIREVLRETRPEILIHAAWTTKHGQYWTNPENLDWVTSTLDLAREFIEAGGRRIVTIGTCAEYDWTCLGILPCRETATPTRPQTLYGAAKHAVAEVVGAYCRTTGTEHAHARLFLLYGEGEQSGRLVPSIVQSLLAGRPARTTTGLQIRDFMNVRDAGAAIACLALGRITGPLNVASGEPVPVRRIAEIIGELTGRPELIEFGAIPDRKDDPSHLFADVQLLTDAIGFRPTGDLFEGLRHTIETWRDKSSTAATFN